MKCPKSLTVIWQLLPLTTIIKEWRCLKFGLWDCRSLLLQPDCWDERAEKLYKHYSEGSINPPKMNPHKSTQHSRALALTWYTKKKYRWPFGYGSSDDHVRTSEILIQRNFINCIPHGLQKPANMQGVPPRLAIILGLACGKLRRNYHKLQLIQFFTV